VHHGARVVGVLLSGALHDGSLGLSAVARCGGVTVVQAPEDAIDAEMPSNALRAARVDHCLPALAIPALLEQIVAQPIPESPPAPDDLRLEARVALLAREPDAPTIVTGEPVPVACPDCGGALSLVRHGPSYGFRCHIGHAYSPSAMLAQHGVVLERALWVAFRTLKERIALLSKLIEEARANGRSGVEGFQERVRELEHQAAAIHHAMAILNESGFELEPGVKGE
jgi:two-component system chemotaxis response regulator CheB